MNSHIPNKTNLLMKDFALVGLALKQRRKVTRKPQLRSNLHLQFEIIL